MGKNDMRSGRAFSRRDFVTNAALIGAGLSVAPLFGCDNERPGRKSSVTTAGTGGNMETRPLGTRKLGTLEVSALGHGA